MRDVLLSEIDHLPAVVLPIATTYPTDHLLPWHVHRRAQFLYAATGTMLVETDDGAWTVPGERAVLIPPGVRHQVRMLDVQTASLYIEPSAVAWWPPACRVVEVPSLLRQLLLAAAHLDADYAEDSRDDALMKLILLEVAVLAEMPLHIALPHQEPFAQLCREYLANPDLAVRNSDWARSAAMSERMLTHRFRHLTGTSPAAWRSRARLLAAIPLLRHKTVTEVATRLGYASPAAFSYAFTRAFAVPPSSMRS